MELRVNQPAREPRRMINMEFVCFLGVGDAPENQVLRKYYLQVAGSRLGLCYRNFTLAR